MNKKELNDLIDRIVLTGPGGVDKIKKALKELTNGSGSEGGEGGDVQIVELTYDHLPATGTLSASDLEKLDGDNCLLIINGKYFYKTFSANIGFDYHEIALANVLGGVRSIYFTASKPDGEYTIAYTYSVQANTQAQTNATLENIKVGNTTYSVPLSPMIVEGTADRDNQKFIPASGSPTWTEVYDHMLSGGLVYSHFIEDEELVGCELAVSCEPGAIEFWSIVWLESDDQEPDDPIIEPPSV